MTHERTAHEPATFPLDSPLSSNEENAVKQINIALRIGALDRAIELIGELAKARGMGRIAIKTGLNRSYLYRAFGTGGNPSLDIVMRICDELNLSLQIVSK